jgi:hypothetical protein
MVKSSDSTDKKREFLELALKRFDRCVTSSSKIREAFLNDIKFLNGDQWDEIIKQERKDERRPALTINRLPASHNQVVNDFRQNRPTIKVRPVDSQSDPDKADVINGILRRIQNLGDSKTAIDTAFYYAVGGGFGFFRVKTDYIAIDSFEQDIYIEKIENPCSVYFPLDSISYSDYSDAMYCFVRYGLDKEEFKRKYPNASEKNFEKNGTGNPNWNTEDLIYVAEYFYIEEKPLYLTLLSDGTKHLLEEKVSIGESVPNFQELTVEKVRETTKRIVHRAVINEHEELEPDTIFPGNWIPIVPMLGQEVNIEGEKIYISLTRFATDPQKMFNFWNSAFTEQIALSPKSPWLIAEGQVEGHEGVWNKANTKNVAYLPYRSISSGGQMVPPPIRTQPPQVGTAIITGIQYAADNLKATTGIFDASLGAQGNETSGRAITARQRQGSTSNFHFSDNATRALHQLGVIIKDLIPVIYDSVDRVVQIVGEDMIDKVVTLNKSNPSSEGDLYDVSVGEYDVIVDIGPAYETKRVELTETLLSLSQSNPIYSQIAPDLIVQSLDFPGRDELTKRLKGYLRIQFPQLIEDDSKDKKDNSSQQLQQSQVAMQQMSQQLEQSQIAIQQYQVQMQQMQQVIMKLEDDTKTLNHKLLNKDQEIAAKIQIEQMKIDLEILKMETDAKIKIMQEETKKNSNQADFLLRSQESQRQDIELSKNLNEKSEDENDRKDDEMVLEE